MMHAASLGDLQPQVEAKCAMHFSRRLLRSIAGVSKRATLAMAALTSIHLTLHEPGLPYGMQDSACHIPDLLQQQQRRHAACLPCQARHD